jgi:hypothetical protein
LHAWAPLATGSPILALALALALRDQFSARGGRPLRIWFVRKKTSMHTHRWRTMSAVHSRWCEC